jgi:hypothetical protein
VVPKGLDPVHMCILHFTLSIEQECAEMRRETALAPVVHERQRELMDKIAARGEMLVNVAMSGFPMSDELKARILSTLLTLMNTRENMDRAAMRQSALRRFAG